MHAAASSRLSATQTRSEHDRIRRAASRLCPTHEESPGDARSERGKTAKQRANCKSESGLY